MNVKIFYARHENTFCILCHLLCYNLRDYKQHILLPINSDTKNGGT